MSCCGWLGPVPSSRVSGGTHMYELIIEAVIAASFIAVIGLLFR